jgi:hypothetical protein
VRKPQGKRSLALPKHRREDNIKMGLISITEGHGLDSSASGEG